MDFRTAMMLAEQADLTFKVEVNDYHSGQMDCTLNASLGGEVVGKIDFAIFQNQPSIQMITVSPDMRRQGVARALMKKLQSEFPDQEINWGTLTADGAALKTNLKTKTIHDPEVAEKADRLKALKAKEAEYQERWEALSSKPQAERDSGIEAMSDWNDLNDEIDRLERELHFAKPSKTLIEP